MKRALLMFWLISLAGSLPGQESNEQTEPKLPALLQAKPFEAPAGASQERQLQLERYNAALDAVQLSQELFDHGKIRLSDLAHHAEALRESGLDLWQTPADRVTFLASYLEYWKHAERRLEVRARIGPESALEIKQADYHRLSAELALLRARQANSSARKPAQ